MKKKAVQKTVKFLAVYKLTIKKEDLIAPLRIKAKSEAVYSIHTFNSIQ